MTMRIVLWCCLVLFLSCSIIQVKSFAPIPANARHHVIYHEARRKNANSVHEHKRHRFLSNSRVMLAIIFELDPDSEQAQSIVVNQLGLSKQQYSQLKKLSHLVSEWNERINLISRKDCNPATVFGRHVLPSLACCALGKSSDDEEMNPMDNAKRVIDVGTGGGFPGLPLAIAYPNCDFVLLDSVGKKLMAVQEMAHELGLDNVQIHHGRAEDSFINITKNNELFDVAMGRSVSSIPQFCSWMHHAIRRSPSKRDDDKKTTTTGGGGGGHLLYWIGGDISEVTDMLQESKHDILSDTPIEQLLGIESDKRILVFSQETVTYLAKKSGLLNPSIARSSTNKNNNKNKMPRRHQPTTKKSQETSARGKWNKNRRGDNETKQRGYEDFQRYSSQ